eukprot:2614247-Amphidinium_carterae.1
MVLLLKRPVPDVGDERVFLPEEIWLHVGLQYWTPCRSTFLEMKRCTDVSELEAYGQADETRILLEACSNVLCNCKTHCY